MAMSRDEPGWANIVALDQYRTIPRVMVDTSDRGLTLSQVSWLNSLHLTPSDRTRLIVMLREQNRSR
jgi:hypothetical protein